jgi:TolB-like protein/Flp pilus assembly protein TadD
MNERHSFLTATLAELNRRKVLKTVGAYAVAVFVLLQLMDAAVEPLRLPDALPTIVVILAILGFPLVFLLAWHLEIRSDGIHRTRSAGLLGRSQRMLLFSLMLVATGGLGYVFYHAYSGVLDSTAAPLEAAAGREFSAPENSIAVLPFTDLSEDSDQEHLADGISEEILNLLAQIDGLNVAARTSSFAFRDAPENIREIGRLLNVRTVLEGSVRTSGGRVRLTAQLINVADGFHIWSKVYDSEMSDILSIQEQVASQIATALVESFDGLQIRSATRTDSVAAAQAYRTGRLHWWRRTPDELQKAIELFATALEHDATYAPAYAAMADTWLLIAQYGNVSTVKATAKAQTMIGKALEIDPESAEGFAALGLARWQIGQMDAAESALRHATELNEDYIPAQLWLAGVLGQQGRYPEQSLVLEQAMQRDPLNELLLVNFAGNLSIRGEWERGKNLLGELLALRPDSTILLRFMSSMEALNGNLVEGWKLANRAYQLQPENPEDIAALARTWVLLGDAEEAERLLLEGLSIAGANPKLRDTYWTVLMIEGRYEEADRLVKEQVAEYGDDLPDALRREFNLRLGMVALNRGDYQAARTYLSDSVGAEGDEAWNVDEIATVTLASLAFERTGDAEEAARLLQRAERKIRRARLNGVDNPDIYYSEAVLFTLRNQPVDAIEKLRAAYERGFRERWFLEVDTRLDPLRGRPEFRDFRNRIRDDLAQAILEIRSLGLAAL